MGWLIALAVMVGLFSIPLGVSVRYNEDGMQFKILAGWIPFSLPKGKKTEKKPKKKTKKEKKTEKKTDHKPKTPSQKEPEKKGGSILDFLPFVEIGLNLLGDFRRKLRVRRLEMKLVLAGDDPCDVAVNYGRAWTALGNLMPLLERMFVIKKRNLEVGCDFESTETRISARVDVTITPGGALKIVLYHGLRALKAYMNLKKIRKGGTTK